MMSQHIPVCAVVGPTASGKSDLAVSLAKQFHGEVISFDSMQIYRDAPIATAVPTTEEQQGMPHHLLTFLDCDQQFSVARYTELAHQTIREVYHKGKLPVLVGGTGLYYSSLLDHLQFSRENNEITLIREQLKLRCETEGIEVLYRELQQIDPKRAATIHINNQVRVLRALEIYYATGKTMSQQVEESRSVPTPYEPCVIGLNYRDRKALYDRINQRVYGMLKAGMEQEVRAVYQKHPTGTLMQAIGIKEFIPYFQEKCTLEQVVESIQKNSRHYAKRQLTWFKRDPKVQWLYCDDYQTTDELFAKAGSIVSDFLSKVEE